MGIKTAISWFLDRNWDYSLDERSVQWFASPDGKVFVTPPCPETGWLVEFYDRHYSDDEANVLETHEFQMTYEVVQFIENNV